MILRAERALPVGAGGLSKGIRRARHVEAYEQAAGDVPLRGLQRRYSSIEMTKQEGPKSHSERGSELA